MKNKYLKILLFAILILTSSAANARNLWKGNVVFQNWDEHIVLLSGSLRDVSFGDKISISIKDVTGTGGVDDYPIVVVKTSTKFKNIDDWPLIATTLNGLLNGQNTLEFYVTYDILNMLRQYGLIIQGAFCTVTSVEVTPTKYSHDGDYSDAIWMGIVPFEYWANYVLVPNLQWQLSCAKAGDIMRINYEITGDEGPGIKLGYLSAKDWSWVDFGAYVHDSIPAARCGYVDIPLTEEFMSVWGNYNKCNSALIRGRHVTITCVKVFDKNGNMIRRKKNLKIEEATYDNL
ncbi:MAG: hypothetical protein J5676_04120 [Bacteroidaceae bacterium]|nr:hypothetical protein [Bacteroidaceae bacterium]